MASIPVVCLRYGPWLAAVAALLPSCSDQITVGWDESDHELADASSDQVLSQDAATDAAADSDGLLATCESEGGACVSDVPGACGDGGSWADAGALGCSTATRCCLAAATADSGVPTCESVGGTCLSVGPTSCADGHWTGPTQNSCNDWVGVLCCAPGTISLPDGGSANACEAIGGVCVGLGPNLCQNALWQAPIPFLCGSALDQGCCFPL